MTHFKEMLEVQDGKCRMEIDKEKWQEGTFSRMEVREAIGKMKRKKAAGEHGIMNEAWIFEENWLEEDFKDIMNKIWEKGIPKKWRKGVICPVYKKGYKKVKKGYKEVKNYRPMTLMDSGYKLYMNILGKKLRVEIEEKKC